MLLAYYTFLYVQQNFDSWSQFWYLISWKDKELSLSKIFNLVVYKYFQKMIYFLIFLCYLIRGDDFPFQKIVFSIWENSEFRFKGLSKWKFRLAIDTVHKNSVYERNTNYESGYFQRVTWSVSHCDIACAALRDWMIHVRCRASWPHIACILLCRECLAWIARCDDWTENWSTYMYVTIARVRLQQKYFCTHFLCACTVGMIFSVHTCSDDSDPCPGHGNVTCTWQLACEGLYRALLYFLMRE